MAVSPEETGLCGCWQLIAVERASVDLTAPEAPCSFTLSYYASSLSVTEQTTDEIGAIIRDHWSAIENGTHYRRDVTLGEDANRTADRMGATVLATLRNLANGLYELEQASGASGADSLRSWCQRQTFSTAWRLLSR